jgi:hypothetical protein
LFDSDITALQKDLAKIRHNYFTAQFLRKWKMSKYPFFLGSISCFPWFH